MNILITGANGQLGSEIKEISGNYPGWKFFFTDIDTLDLTNSQRVEAFIKSNKPDYLINCAAYTAVDKAESDAEKAKLLNADVPAMLAEFSVKYGIRFIHISTDYVFSGNMNLPIKEYDEIDPASVYGQTKRLGEQNVLEKCDAIIIRTAWLYSKYGNNFVKTMLRLGKEKEKIGVVYDQVGTPTNGADLAEAILHIIKWSEDKKCWEKGVYHYSNEGVCSWYDFAKVIMELGNRKCKVLPLETYEYPLPAPRPVYSVFNKKKIKDTFNLSVPYWKDSLVKVIHHLI